APTSVSCTGDPIGNPVSTDIGCQKTTAPAVKNRPRPSEEKTGYETFPTSGNVICFRSLPSSKMDQNTWLLKLRAMKIIRWSSAYQAALTCPPAGFPTLVICRGVPPCTGITQIVEEPTLPDPMSGFASD